MRVLTYLLAADGSIPNHPRWPLLVYENVASLSGRDPAAIFEELFTRNRWPAAWRNGVFPFHHYHSNSHEALGVVGAYPEGQHPDTCIPFLVNGEKAAAAVARVPLPACDPVYGAGGPLFTYWLPQSGR